MILGFGVIVLGIIGAVGASLAAPFAVVVGGVSELREVPRDGLAMGLFAWVPLTAAAIVGLYLGIGGNADSGMTVHGAALEDLLWLVPLAWVLAVLAWLGFFTARQRRQADQPDRK